MPTEKPRLTITLEPSLDRDLTAFAKATGQSKSAVIVDALSQTQTFMRKTAELAQSIQRARPEALQTFRARAQTLENMVDSLTHAIGSGLDLFLPASIPSRTEPAEVERGQRSPEPPSVNKGVDSPTPLKPSRVVRMKKRATT